MGVLTYSSLQQALLTGKFTDPSTVPEGRRRTRLFAADSTPKSRHGGPGVESELFAGKKPVTFSPLFTFK
jgi:aryl-alcohol dehydrogenase-like predicted oxidoreductase